MEYVCDIGPAQNIPFSLNKYRHPIILQGKIPQTLASGYNTHGIIWFTNGIVKIDLLQVKVKSLVAGLEFPTKWANCYAI